MRTAATSTPLTGRMLLDTSIAVAYLNQESAVVDFVHGAGEVFVTVTVLGELYHGAQRSERSAENVVRVDRLASRVPVLPCDTGTARVYGSIKTALRRLGTPIPENDVWIASVALQHGLTLASRDQHFHFVQGLRVTSP